MVPERISKDSRRFDAILGERGYPRPRARGRRAQWSPDGRSILYFRSVSGLHHEIALIDVDGTHGRFVASSPAEDFQPAWSPDGRQIAFASQRDGGPGGVDVHVFVVAPDGSGLRELPSEPLLTGQPVWSPDGRFIVAWPALRQAAPFVDHLNVLDAVGSSPATPISVDNSVFTFAWQRLAP